MKAKQSKALPMDIGISELDRKRIAGGLSALLADSYTLYLMTHNFHWNVTGPQFNSLHNMFMTQYTEQWTALDEIANDIDRSAKRPTVGFNLRARCLPEPSEMGCNPITKPLKSGAGEGIRTLDPCLAKAVLSQLSHIPVYACRDAT